MPIARREMLILARSPATFRSRIATGIGSTVAGAGVCFVYAKFGVSSALPAIAIISFVLLMMCIFLGAQLTCDAIARERREGTLGLLFLTNLTSWEITLGKLIAHGLAAFFAIFVTFPLISFLMILGGVGPLQVLLIALSLLNTLFIAACVGLFASSFSLEQKRAAGRATSMAMFLWWGLPFLSQINARLGGPVWLTSGLLLTSLNPSLGPSFGRPGAMTIAPASLNWLNLLSTHLVGWLFLISATLLLRRRWQDKPTGVRLSLTERWKRLSLGSAKTRARLRHRLLDKNPFLWLASRDRLRYIGGWIVTLSLLIVAVWSYYLSAYNWQSLISFVLILNLIHHFLAAGTGATQLLVEQEQGTLEMLLSSPLSISELIRGQILASFRHLRGPVCLALGAHIILLVLLSTERGVSPLVKAIVLLSLFCYLPGIYTGLWLALWGAVISANARHATGAATLRLVGIPCLIILGGTLVYAALTSFLNLNVRSPATLFCTGIGTVIVLNYGFWLRRTRLLLPDLLRTYAFRRYQTEEAPGFWGKIGRSLGAAYGRRKAPRPSSAHVI